VTCGKSAKPRHGGIPPGVFANGSEIQQASEFLSPEIVDRHRNFACGSSFANDSRLQNSIRQPGILVAGAEY
jgi:hypothetical protein